MFRILNDRNAHSAVRGATTCSGPAASIGSLGLSARASGPTSSAREPGGRQIRAYDR